VASRDPARLPPGSSVVPATRLGYSSSSLSITSDRARFRDVIDVDVPASASDSVGAGLTGDRVGDFVGDLVSDLVDLVGDLVGDLVVDLVGDFVSDLVDDLVGDLLGDCVSDFAL